MSAEHYEFIFQVGVGDFRQGAVGRRVVVIFVDVGCFVDVRMDHGGDDRAAGAWRPGFGVRDQGDAPGLGEPGREPFERPASAERSPRFQADVAQATAFESVAGPLVDPPHAVRAGQARADDVGQMSQGSITRDRFSPSSLIAVIAGSSAEAFSLSAAGFATDRTASPGGCACVEGSWRSGTPRSAPRVGVRPIMTRSVPFSGSKDDAARSLFPPGKTRLKGPEREDCKRMNPKVVNHVPFK